MIQTANKGVRKYLFEPLDEEIDLIVSKLKRVISQEEKKEWFLYAYGKQTKELIAAIGDTNGLEILWSGRKGSRWVKLLGSFFASQSALIKIDNADNLKYSLEKLSNLSMVGIFNVPIDLVDEFIETVSGNSRMSYPDDFLMHKDPSFFGFMLDGDNEEVESGRLGIILHGKETSEDLKNIVQRFGEVGYLGVKKI